MSIMPVIQNSATRPVALLPQPGLSAGGPIYSSQNVRSISVPSNGSKEQGRLSSSVTTYPLTRKRAISHAVAEVPSSSKKSRAKLPSKKTPFNGTYNLSDKSPATQISNVSAEKGSVLANQSPNNSTSPTTPPQEVSSLNGQSITPVGLSSAANCSNSNTPQETPTNCTLITSERVTVSPCKHVSYTMERNQCISSSLPVKTTFKRFSKRENVKGRLYFDGTDVANSFDAPIIEEISTSGSEKETDLFDIDFDSFEAFGASFSELLVDLDLGFDGLECPCQPISELPIDTSPGSSHESRDGNLGNDLVASEFSSTVKVVNFEGSNTVTAVKSMTKCIILSLAKSHRSALVQENSLQRA